MARNEPQINFRLSQELKDKIEASALKNNRTTTQELVNIISQYYLTNNTIHEYHDLKEPAMSIHSDNVTIGLMQSHYKDVKLQKNFHNQMWTLSYYALRCTISEELAKALIEKGCKLEP